MPSTVSEVGHFAPGAQRREPLLKAWGNEALPRRGFEVGSQSIRRLVVDKGQRERCEHSPGGVTTHSTRTELAWAQGAGGKIAEVRPICDRPGMPFEFCPRELCCVFVLFPHI